jgi:hypothetical protein
MFGTNPQDSIKTFSKVNLEVSTNVINEVLPLLMNTATTASNLQQPTALVKVNGFGFAINSGTSLSTGLQADVNNPSMISVNLGGGQGAISIDGAPIAGAMLNPISIIPGQNKLNLVTNVNVAKGDPATNQKVSGFLNALATGAPNGNSANTIGLTGLGLSAPTTNPAGAINFLQDVNIAIPAKTVLNLAKQTTAKNAAATSVGNVVDINGLTPTPDMIQAAIAGFKVNAVNFNFDQGGVMNTGVSFQ